LAKSRLLALLFSLVVVGILMNAVSVSALNFGNATRVFQNQIFDVWGLSSSSVARVGHLYTGSGCVSSNLVQTQAAVVNLPPVYIVAFGGESPGPHSVEVDGDSDGCVNFNVLPYPTTTVTVTNTVTTTVTQATTVTVTTSSIVEYPYGLPILALLMIFAYAITKRRTNSPRNKSCPVS
jgi:hypothetical protein